MNNKMNISAKIWILVLALLTIAMMSACSSSQSESEAPAVTVIANNSVVAEGTEETVSSDSGYPGFSPLDPTPTIDGYPGQSAPEGVQTSPPDPERSLEPPAPELGAVGGVLIREIVDTGFFPVVPNTLYLGEVLIDSEGRQALIARAVDSPEAELFPTGVFAFNGVKPGTYGLVIDLGFAEFPLTNEDGSELLVTIEAGKAIDLGQILVETPN